jgi:hypothetical protein
MNGYMAIPVHQHTIEIAVRGIGEDARIAHKALS